MRARGPRVGLALAIVAVAACGPLTGASRPARPRVPETPATAAPAPATQPAPGAGGPLAGAPAAGTAARGETAGAGEATRVADQLARLTQEIAELQSAVARLVGVSERQLERLGELERRLLETRRAAEPAPAAAPAPPPSAVRPAGPALPPAGSAVPPEALYREGLARARAGETDAAILVLYEVVTGHPGHPLRARAQLLVADLLLAQQDHRAARVELENLLADVPDGEGTPEALLKLGVCEHALGDVASAREHWERVVRDYPRSPSAREARERLRATGR